MRLIDNKICEIEIYNNDYKKIRNIINEKNNIAINIDKKDIKDSKKNIVRQSASWGIICACMDRLEDTVGYLNGFRLKYNQNQRQAFDFYELLNNIYVVINCIEELYKNFSSDSTDLKELKKRNSIFKEFDFDGGTDYDFFKYIRSLCAVHPIRTDKKNHKAYLGKSLVHSCPYVLWENDDEIKIIVYNSKGELHNNGLNIKIEYVEKFLNVWLEFSNVLITKIVSYYDEVYVSFRSKKIKEEKNLEDYVEYLLYLRNENERRFNYSQEYIFDYYINVFYLKLTNICNKEKLEKYKNAIRLAMKYKSASIQSMQTEGFEYTGINNPKMTYDNSLFFELESPETLHTDFEKFGYNIAKMYNLMPDNSHSGFDEDWAREMLEEMKSLINKYVYFTNKEPNIETVILVIMAMYFANFEVVDSDLNRNIPKNNNYR